MFASSTAIGLLPEPRSIPDEINQAMRKMGRPSLEFEAAQVDTTFDVELQLSPDVVCEDDVSFDPTDANPGTDAKVEVMCRRYEQGLPLFHPDDEKVCAVRVGVVGGLGQFEKVVPDFDVEDDD